MFPVTEWPVTECLQYSDENSLCYDLNTGRMSVILMVLCSGGLSSVLLLTVVWRMDKKYVTQMPDNSFLFKWWAEKQTI